MAPCASRPSKLRYTGRQTGRMTPEGPPICTALYWDALPWEKVSSTALRGDPKGSSMSPVRSLHPVTQNNFVPGFSSVPCSRNRFAPSLIIKGIFANVSTLFRQVGCPHRPISLRWVSLARGAPTLFSSALTRAEDSPHTYVPPLRTTVTQNDHPLPNMLLPRRPAS